LTNPVNPDVSLVNALVDREGVVIFLMADDLRVDEEIMDDFGSFFEVLDSEVEGMVWCDIRQ
jgi:hypothetical protein